MRIIKFLASIIVSMVCLYLAIRKVNFNEVFQILSSSHYRWVLIASLICIVKTLLMGIRWRYFIPISEKLSPVKLAYCYSIGNMTNMILPFRAGDFVRVFIAAKEYKIAYSKLFGTLISEHVLDFFILFCLLGSTLWIYSYYLPGWIQSTIIICSAVMCIFLVTFVVLLSNKTRAKRLLLKICQLSPKHFLKISTVALSFFSGFFQFQNKKNIRKLLAGTFAIWVAHGLWVYALLNSLEMVENYQLGTSAILMLVTSMGLAIMIPSSPSYVGTLHLMVVLTLEKLGVPHSAALSYAVLVHAHGTLIAIILGVYSLWKEKFKLSLNPFQRDYEKYAVLENKG